MNEHDRFIRTAPVNTVAVENGGYRSFRVWRRDFMTIKGWTLVSVHPYWIGAQFAALRLRRTLPDPGRMPDLPRPVFESPPPPVVRPCVLCDEGILHMQRDCPTPYSTELILEES